MKNSFWVDKIVFLWYNDDAFSPYRRKVTKGARLTALYARIVRDFGLLTIVRPICRKCGTERLRTRVCAPFSRLRSRLCRVRFPPALLSVQMPRRRPQRCGGEIKR